MLKICPTIRWKSAGVAAFAALSSTFAVSFHRAWLWHPGASANGIGLANGAIILSRAVGYTPLDEADRVISDWERGWECPNLWFHVREERRFGLQWFVVPLLPLIVISGLVWFAARAASGRPLDGPFCSCGYDLTGNVTGTCPECGTKLAKSAELAQ